MRKTYVPGLKAILRKAHRYATRWQLQLKGQLSPEQYNSLVIVIKAIMDCLVLLEKPTKQELEDSLQR